MGGILLLVPRLLSLLLLLLVPASAQSTTTYCDPHDYDRQSSACQGGVRSVKYGKVRDCLDPFAGFAGNAHEEVCNCSPEDYTVEYQFQGEKCMMHYVPKNASLPQPTGVPSCEANVKVESLEVDEAYCELSNVPCTEEDILVTYSECFYKNEIELGEGNPLTGQPFFEVIYYFDRHCNPKEKGSARLPPPGVMPCATTCGAGSILKKTQCEKCPAGTFSSGGATRFKTFYTQPTKDQGFQYSCEYTNATGTWPCDNWHVEAGTMAVGPFNEPNNWYQDECASDPAYDCYNNLKASMKMTVKLKRAGFVSFKYRVSAEKGYDGLSFYIDYEDEPDMPLQSSQFNPLKVQFALTEGYHTLMWVYSKDEKWTAGSDTASIEDLEIDGTDFNELVCHPCDAGFYSEAGASECLPCPANFISAFNSSQCQACADTEYSLTIPRVKCLPRQPCDASLDVGITYSPCNKNSRKRTRSAHWLKPHICSGDLPPPSEEDCPPCPSGQFPVVDGENVGCEFCPPGTVRDASGSGGAPVSDQCTSCEDGFVAIKELNLRHMNLEPGTQLPPMFQTGCSQGDCSETGAWRMANGALSSGVFESDSVAAWLQMNVSLEMIGEVTFNFSVDIPNGDDSRGFFFYVDGTPVDEVVDDGQGATPVSPQALLSGPWQVEKGEHTLMWKWVKANATRPAQRDTAIIYDIKVRGVANGGATTCERVPDGAQLTDTKSSWEECPAGYYSDGGNSKCAKCPANTFNPYTFGGKWACLSCGAGTTAVEGSTSCEIGDVNVPDSFCHYFLQSSSNSSIYIVYDLAPLSRLHPGRMFGPIYHDPSSKEGDKGPLYYVSVCDKHITNYTCLDNARKPLNTSMCRVNPETKVEGSFRPSHSLGDRVALQPLGLDYRLERRGFEMVLNGERCYGNQIETNTTISFICDPGAGYGIPAAWTVAGRQAAFNPLFDSPSNWVDHSASDVIPVGNQETCTYQLVWYSAFACPMCTRDDYEAVEVSGCVNNTLITYKYKQPQLCQPNPESPLPPDVPCHACTVDEYQEFRDACADDKGVHNVTYRWIHPKLCDDTVPGSVKLPEDVVAGLCVHTVYLESANLLKPQYLVLLILGTLAIVVLAVTSLVTWLKSRRIYAMYSKLVASEEAADAGDFGAHEEEMEEVEGQATSEDTRLVEEEEIEVTADPTEYREDEEGKE